MKLILITLVAVVVGMMVGCSAESPPTQPMPNIQATVAAAIQEALPKSAPPPDIDGTIEAKVQAAIESHPTATPYPTYPALPTYTPLPTYPALPTYTPLPTSPALPTYTPVPTPTTSYIPPTRTPVPTHTPTPRPTPTPVIRAGVGWRQSWEGVAITLNSLSTVGSTIVRADFTIENLSYEPFTFNILDTEIQTSDGRRYTYDFDAYTEEMHRQPMLPRINTGDTHRETIGYLIPAGSTVTKFFYDHPSYYLSDFSFFID